MCIYTIKKQKLKKNPQKGGARLHRTSHKLGISGVNDTANLKFQFKDYNIL